MNKKFQTNFTVMPIHTNYMSPLIFGGAFFSQLDLCAAQTVKRLLYASEKCESAVTYKFEGTYHKPCYCGDLIFIEGEIVSARHKSIVVETKAYRETKDGREFVAEAKFVFISIADNIDVKDKPQLLPYESHGLILESTETNEN